MVRGPGIFYLSVALIRPDFLATPADALEDLVVDELGAPVLVAIDEDVDDADPIHDAHTS